MFQAYEVVTNAAREGARVRVLPGYSNGDAITRVNEYLAAAGLSGTAITTPTPVSALPGSPAGSAYEVRVVYNHQFTVLGPILRLIGGNFLDSINLTAASVMRSEIAP
jgi:hypothetical protein